MCLVRAKAAIQIVLSSFTSNTPAVEFVTDQIQKRVFVSSGGQSSHTQQYRKRPKTSEQKDLEKRFKSIKTELKALKATHKTPAIVDKSDMERDEYIEILGATRGRKMKEFVTSIAVMCSARAVCSSTQVVQRRIAYTSNIDVENICKVCIAITSCTRRVYRIFYNFLLTQITS